MLVIFNLFHFIFSSNSGAIVVKVDESDLMKNYQLRYWGWVGLKIRLGFLDCFYC